MNIEGFNGTESRHFFLGEGTCSGNFTGRFRGANHPRRRTDQTYMPDFQGVILTDDGASFYFDYLGYGRAYLIGRQQIVCAVWHLSGDPPYGWLNDVVCVDIGEVRAMPAGQPHPSTGVTHEEMTSALVLDVAELVWEPLPDTYPG